MVFCNNCPFLGLKCCCLPAAVCYCLFLGVSGIDHAGQNYLQASRLFFAFSVSGWRVQQKKCEVTKKQTRKKGKKKTTEKTEGRESVSTF